MKSRSPDTPAPAMRAALLTAPRVSKHEDTPAAALARAKAQGITGNTPAMRAALLRALTK